MPRHARATAPWPTLRVTTYQLTRYHPRHALEKAKRQLTTSCTAQRTVRLLYKVTIGRTQTRSRMGHLEQLPAGYHACMSASALAPLSLVSRHLARACRPDWPQKRLTTAKAHPVDTLRRLCPCMHARRCMQHALWRAIQRACTGCHTPALMWPRCPSTRRPPWVAGRNRRMRPVPAVRTARAGPRPVKCTTHLAQPYTPRTPHAALVALVARANALSRPRMGITVIRSLARSAQSAAHSQPGSPMTRRLRTAGRGGYLLAPLAGPSRVRVRSWDHRLQRAAAQRAQRGRPARPG